MFHVSNNYLFTIITYVNLNIDTENIHKRSATEVAAKFGKTYNLDLRYRVLGAPELVGAKLVVSELKLPVSVEEYINMIHAIENKVMSDVDILPGSYFLFYPL